MAANTPQQHVQAVKKAEDENKQQKQQQNKDTVEYTIIVSGLNYGQNANLLAEADTEHINIVFDCVTNYSLTQNVEKSSYAVETGTVMSDHAVIKDKVFSLHGIVNTSPTFIRRGNVIDQDVDKNNPAASLRPTKALEILQRCVDDRQVVTIASEEGLFDEFIITELKASRDVGEGAGLAFDITLTEFRTFEINRLVNANIYTDPKKTPQKNKGAVSSSSNNAANSDKMKEPTVMKGAKFTLVQTENSSTWYDNETGEMIAHKGGYYKPNVGLVVNK